MKTRIIIDSTFDVADKIKDKVTVVPLTIRFGDEEFVDGVDITRQGFYKKLMECEALPTTSQATPFAFAKCFKEAVDCGDDVIAITIASTLSGTHQSALIAAMDFPGKVFVVDSTTAAAGSGILAEYAVSLAEQGKGAEEIAEILNEEKKKVHVMALLDTLEYLKRGGRISKTVAFAGGLLSIKPVVQVKDGEVAMVGKARGLKQAGAFLNKEIESYGGADLEKPFLLGYTGLSDERLNEYVNDSENWKRVDCPDRRTIIGGVIGTHIGPGSVVLAFFEK